MPASENGSFCANAIKIAAGILCVRQGNLKPSVAKTVLFYSTVIKLMIIQKAAIKYNKAKCHSERS